MQFIKQFYYTVDSNCKNTRRKLSPKYRENVELHPQT